MKRFNFFLFLVFFSYSLAFATTTYNQNYDICLNDYAINPLISLSNYDSNTILYEVDYTKTNKIQIETMPYFITTNTHKVFLK